MTGFPVYSDFMRFWTAQLEFYSVETYIGWLGNDKISGHFTNPAKVIECRHGLRFPQQPKQL